MSVAIIEHYLSGAEVHVLLATDGEATDATDILNGNQLSAWWGLPHSPADEHYAPLSPANTAAARVRELYNALECMTSGAAGSLTLHRAELPDGKVTVEDAQLALLTLCNDIAPGGAVRIKGHTYMPELETHPDHLAVGKALKNLTTYSPTRFSDRRHYIMPGNWTNPNLSLIAHSWDNPTDANIAARARNAGRAYGAWAPAEGMYAIGMHSINSWFDIIMSNPRCMYHA